MAGSAPLDPDLIANLDPNSAGILGQAPRVDPFHVRQVNEDEMVEEVDMSGRPPERLQAEGIDGPIAVVGGGASVSSYKLHRAGLNVVCVPRSIENDIAATSVSFGFNSALSFTIEMLDRAGKRRSPRARLALSRSWASRPAGSHCRQGLPSAPTSSSSPRFPRTSRRWPRASKTG